MTQRKTNQMTQIIVVLFLVAVTLTSVVLGAPIGPEITYVLTSEKSSATGTTVSNSSHTGGTINIMNLNANQKNPHWKAYVGNITGKLTLDDADNYTIYEWSIADLQGEVYATRASSINLSISFALASAAVSPNLNSTDTFIMFLNSRLGV